ncbi:hypothetical protein [Limnobacter litoralis]|nr:hypothetical protein [Limnobacter litoralis]
MTHSPHCAVRKRTWLAGILLSVALSFCVPAWSQVNPESTVGSTDMLCANASSQLAVNLCFSDLVDQQQRQIQAHIVSLKSQAYKGIQADQVLLQFNTFEQTLCGNYPRIFHNSTLGKGSQLYCQYDLNNSFLDQLRNLEDQAHGRHAR